MHHNIKYKDHTSPETQRKACIDVLNWFGSDKYRLIVAAIKSKTYSERQIQFYVSIGGVSGFPVTAMWERYNVAHD